MPSATPQRVVGLPGQTGLFGKCLIAAIAGRTALPLQ